MLLRKTFHQKLELAAVGTRLEISPVEYCARMEEARGECVHLDGNIRQHGASPH